MQQRQFNHSQAFDVRSDAVGERYAGRPISLPARVTQPERRAVTDSFARPAFVRRVVAEVIDRLAPLPFIVAGYFWPEWLAVVFAWHLLRDAGPRRRSLGKWVCRLHVERVNGAPCAWWQAALRRAGSAVSQVAYCVPGWWVLAFVYDLATVACVLLSPVGQRLEDWPVGTRVMGKKGEGMRG
jgi:uncharacterized RDD family membrane protein YckC